MSFLYAGLGIAMLSGIIAMMQISNNVENFVSLMSKEHPDANDYIDSKSPSYDKDIIKILYQDQNSLPQSEICEYLVNKLNEVKPDNFRETTVPTNKFFNQSCALENNDGKHRVVINQTPNKKYELFSCTVKEKIGEYCKFEIGDKK